MFSYLIIICLIPTHAGLCTETLDRIKQAVSDIIDLTF